MNDKSIKQENTMRDCFYYIPHLTTFFAAIIVFSGMIYYKTFSKYSFYLFMILLQTGSLTIMKFKSLQMGRITFLSTTVAILVYYQLTQTTSVFNFTIFYSMYLFFIPLYVFLLNKPLNIILVGSLTCLLCYKLFFWSDLQLYEAAIVFIFSFLAMKIIFISKENIKSLTEYKIKSFTRTQEVTLHVLGKVAEINDQETSLHLKRVETIVELLATILRDNAYYKAYITDDYIKDIKAASTLHDIGKIGIPSHILNKEGLLNQEEFIIIRNHTVIGFNLLDDAKKEINERNIYDMAAEIAMYHHEKWDGTGYPEKLKENEIPLSARIMSIADVYDALISKRSYKEAFTHDQAIEIIREESGSHFDPLIADIFIRNARLIEEKIRNFLR